VLILIFCFDDGDNDNNYYREMPVFYAFVNALHFLLNEEKKPTRILAATDRVIALPGCTLHNFG